MSGSRVVKALWIDDDNSIAMDNARNLNQKQKALRIDVLHPCEFLSNFKHDANCLQKWDIFLVDYFLDQHAFNGNNNGEKSPFRGLAFGGIIREKRSEYPIYGISNQRDNTEGIFSSEKHAALAIYDNIYSLSDIQKNGHNIIYYDALNFNLIRKTKRNDIEALFRLLKAPVDNLVKDTLLRALPDVLKKGLDFKEGNTNAFANWVIRTFTEKPGFLYDEQHAAVHLGMRTEYFRKISEKFETARYRGVFFNASRPRWWVSKLSEIVFSAPTAQSMEGSYPREKAVKLYEVPNKQVSVCAICGKPLPETIALDSIDDELKPVHFRCSESDVLKKESFFDEPRKVLAKE